MTRDNIVKHMDTRIDGYTNPAFDDLNSSPIPVNTVRMNASVSNTKEKGDTSGLTFQYRYVVTLFGILVYFVLDSYRINVSMSLVRMVNRTVIIDNKNLNGTVDSCPLNNSYIQELPYPEVGGEFNWSPEIQGYIQSAGFLGYIVCQIPGGIIAETFGAKITLFNGLLISSLAHILCPFAAWYNFYLMIAMQFLRGLGHGVLSPAISVINAKWFPRHERGLLNSVVFSGCAIGSLITYATSGAFCSSTLLGGWPLVYFVYGGFGLMLCLSVRVFLYESPKEHPKIRKTELNYILENQESDLSQKRPPVPWRKILTSVPVYAMVYSIFSHFWILSHQLSEHPIFLANILHFPIQTNGMLNSIPFVFQIILIFFGGWISKWLNTHGYIGVNKVRKGCTLIYSLGCSLALLGMYFAGCNRVWNNICCIVAFSLLALSVPGCIIVPSDMSPIFAGSLFAFSNTLGSAATFMFPLIVGAMINVEESLEQWNKIFLLSIAVIMSSGVLFCIFGSADVQPWNFPSTENNNKNSPKGEVVKYENKNSTRSKDISIRL